VKHRFLDGGSSGNSFEPLLLFRWPRTSKLNVETERRNWDAVLAVEDGESGGGVHYLGQGT
jgi:hypothetical protein